MATFNPLGWLGGAKPARVANAAEHEEVSFDGPDFRPLLVMVSSPQKLFEAEREALFLAIEQQGELKSLLFDKLPDSGRTNVRESIELADQCDILIALMMPGKLGTPVQPDQHAQLDKEGLKGRHFSEIELECAFRRTNDQTRLPLIHIYVKGGKGAEEKLTDWHTKYRELIACKTFETSDQLVELVRKDVLGNVIKLRTARVRHLAKQLLTTTNNLGQAQEKREHVEARLRDRDAELVERKDEAERMRKRHAKDLDALADRESKALEEMQDALNRERKQREAEIAHQLQRQRAEREELERSHGEVLSQMQSAHASVLAAVNDECERLKRDLAERRRSAVGLLAAGIAAGAVPLLAYSALGGGVAGVIGRQMQSSLALVATAFAQRPVHVSHVGPDPMLLVRKIALAVALADDKGFDCGDSKIDRVPIRLGGEGPASPLLVKDSVCSPFGDMLIEIHVSGLQACAHAPALSAGWWRWFAEKVNKTATSGHLGNWQIAEIRLLGHASGDRVKNACAEAVPEPVFRMAQERMLDLQDRRVTNNTQLAYARALRQENEIATGFSQAPGVPKPSTFSETMGILSAKGAQSDDRKVTVALRLARAP